MVQVQNETVAFQIFMQQDNSIELYPITRDEKKTYKHGHIDGKSFDDCQHIGAAIVNACDCIISWNFRHIVNLKTIRGVRAITNLAGYKLMEIWNPSVLLEGED